MGNGMGGNMYPVNEYGYNAAQDRLNMMEQQRGYNTQNQNMRNSNQVQMQVFKGRPVSNFYEANASLIDLDGSLHIFPDFPNNRIYTKKITLDGTAELKTYALTDNPVEELSVGQKNDQRTNNNMSAEYIGRSEFESHMKALDERMNYFMGRIEGVIGGIVNGQQYGRNDATVPADATDVQIVEQSRADDVSGFREQSSIPKGTTDGKRKNR